MKFLIFHSFVSYKAKLEQSQQRYTTGKKWLPRPFIQIQVCQAQCTFLFELLIYWKHRVQKREYEGETLENEGNNFAKELFSFLIFSHMTTTPTRTKFSVTFSYIRNLWSNFLFSFVVSTLNTVHSICSKHQEMGNRKMK